MQNVSPGTENEGAGRDVAEENNVRTHDIGPGIVNVEQNISSPEDSSGVGCKAGAGTGRPGYPLANRGAVP
jgi:hypothetical protein